MISRQYFGTFMVIQSSHHQSRVGSAGPLRTVFSGLLLASCPANRPSELELCSLLTLSLETDCSLSSSVARQMSLFYVSANHRKV